MIVRYIGCPHNVSVHLDACVGVIQSVLSPVGEGAEEPYLLFIFARTASLLIRVVSAVVVEVASIAQWHTAAIGAVEVLGVTGVHG